MSKKLKEILNRSGLPKADWIGLRQVTETTTLRSARDGKPQDNDGFQSKGIMAEVLVNGQFAYAATPRYDEVGILEAIHRAHEQIGTTSYSVHAFNENHRPKIIDVYSSQVKKPLDALSVGDLADVLVKITEKLKISDKIVRAVSVAQTVEAEFLFASTNGSEAQQNFSLITYDFEATSQSGTLVQKRTDGGMRGRSYQGGWEHFQTDQLWSRVQRVAEQAEELLTADQCPDEVMSLILKPDQMMLQIHESVGHPLELDRILGDERNYAGWSFVNPHDFGNLVYGSPLMNIVFDPTVTEEFASYRFDDTGNLAKREHVIKDGILQRGLGSLESQSRLGIPGVANARASSWNRAPIDRMANLNLEPGTSSLEEMISSVHRGVIMESNRSWSIDDFRNKFQFGCEYGKLIEGGKITRTIRNPNYRGVTVPFWKSLAKVGDQSTYGVYGTPNCGKGEPNQIIRVGHASPVCLFDKIEVFGGA